MTLREELDGKSTATKQIKLCVVNGGGLIRQVR